MEPMQIGHRKYLDDPVFHQLANGIAKLIFAEKISSRDAEMAATVGREIAERWDMEKRADCCAFKR